VAIFLIIGQFLREETDEVMGQLIRTALLWSGALTLCEATVWGFLETFDKVPNIWMWVAPVVFFAQLGVTLPLAARRYR
jgi:quinol-cytochrome oxidoreductase complex cytochrome b subunit